MKCLIVKCNDKLCNNVAKYICRVKDKDIPVCGLHSSKYTTKIPIKK